METYFIYMIYTGVLAIILITLVPKKQIQKLVIYSIIFGAIVDIFAVIFLTHLLDVGGYINYGPFGFMGIPFFPPIAWSIWFILYFYFLPKRQIFQYIYTTTAAAYSVFFSNILVNLNLFKWNYGRLFLPFLIYITWLSTVTWIKKRID